ncbi:MAG TPA: alanine racemase [Gammaproteobacteria bacterium]|nr:alanine racemase [Gammaproteobacteria bacterium]
MTRATRAVIDLAALQHNLRQARAAAPGARVMAIVKANAYGHGLEHVADALAQGEQGCDSFGVACLDEALALRAAGIDRPIVLLEGFTTAGDIELLRRHRLETVVHHEAQLAMLEHAPPGAPIVVWLKVDTGMHRLGFAPEAAAAAYSRLKDCRAVAGPPRLMTHLANADDRTDACTANQLTRFDEATAKLTGPRSIANSAGLLGWSEAQREWVRPGIMLYGVSPFCDATAAELGLRPVMTLHSELIAVNHYRRGDAIGYGGTWVCPEDMPVGVIGIGYGDGYPRHAVSGTPVLVNGRAVQLVGRVSMDMICVDLRTQPRARVGDPVVLWGQGLPVEVVADHASTIGYELLCSVTQRVTLVTATEAVHAVG